jgi:hypothetical protein
MSMRELDRLKCVQAVIDGEQHIYRAAQQLGITTRQLRRLVERYRTEGPAGLISRACRRPSNNRLEPDVEQRITGILRESYEDFGPTLAAEKLQMRHGIIVAKETVRQLQIASGLWIPRKLRPQRMLRRLKGPGYTQSGLELLRLNIDGICANTAAAKGRVERAHLSLQDRLVKELRLERIFSIDAANAFMPRFIEDYNARPTVA